MKYEPHPKNAPGPFYVHNRHCISCEAPEYEAPDVMNHVGDSTGYHCYFQRQPSSPEEVEQAIRAVWVSCCGAVRYGGDDAKILLRLQALRCEESCDLLEDSVPAKGRVIAPRPPMYGPHPLWDRELDG
jgi:hypothetical protein